MTTQNFSYYSPKTFLKLSYNYLHLVWGLLVYSLKGKTPRRSYQAMIHLHCLTSGWLTYFLGKLFATFSPMKSKLSPVKSLVKDLSDDELDEICETIGRDGYYKFDFTLDEKLLNELEEIALNTPCIPDFKNGEETKEEYLFKDVTDPVAKIYRLQEQQTIKHNLVQSLMGDSFFYNIVSRYLKSTPILCSVNMWWSTLFKSDSTGDKEAQQYHFDMSRARWLNFFVYVSDVGPDNGPHCYVKGTSHIKKGSEGHALLRRGYERIPDQDIEKVFGAENVIEFTGKKGTILAVDTIGFHRGKKLIDDRRLMFEMVFSNSLFGGDYLECDLDLKSQALKDNLNYSPRTYRRYRL